MSEHPLPARGPEPGTSLPQARLGLFAIFGSTFFELIGYFMLTPLLILRLKDGGVSTALAGVFAASGPFLKRAAAASSPSRSSAASAPVLVRSRFRHDRAYGLYPNR